MDPVPAHRALGYALSRDVVGSYLVVLTGLVLLVPIPQFVWQFRFEFRWVPGDLSQLAGFVLVHVGLVALLFEVIADAVAETTDADVP
jgi:glucose-6-phosphate-specific signal transduction histidine kinase